MYGWRSAFKEESKKPSKTEALQKNKTEEILPPAVFFF